MKRIVYLLCDSVGTVKARVLAPENEEPTVENWMLHNINVRGWSLRPVDEQDSGVSTHGYADWASVADNLATVLRALLNDEVAPTAAEMEALFDRAQAALDDYDVAHMEVGVAGAEEPDMDEEDPDAETG